LSAKRVIATADVADTQQGLDAIYDEAQKMDGFIVVKKSIDGQPLGNRLVVQEQAQLSAPQVQLMQLSENEIAEISGANKPMMGYDSKSISGTSKSYDIQQGSQVLAPIFGNYRRSLGILGTLLTSAIQQFWNEEKVLRVTDRVSGAERFVEINKQIAGEDGTLVVKNNVTQGKYDIIISEAPATDTVREKTLDMIIEWVKKSPPEIIPTLMVFAFELTDIPNKEKLLAKIRPLLGQQPGEEDLSPEEIKQKALEALEAQKKEGERLRQIEEEKIKLEFEKVSSETEVNKAKAKSLLSDIDKISQENDLKRREMNIKEHQTMINLREKRIGNI
jgi:hypothetical protein